MSVPFQNLISAARFGLLAVLTLALVSGCGWPRVHRVIVQQGNVISQQMIDQLRPGMTRSQVAYIMGEPVVRNTFNDDRWDYVYMLENPGRYEVNSSVSLFFYNDKLSHFAGDLVPSEVLAKQQAEKEAADAPEVAAEEVAAEEVAAEEVAGEEVTAENVTAENLEDAVEDEAPKRIESIERIEEIADISPGSAR